MKYQSFFWLRLVLAVALLFYAANTVFRFAGPASHGRMTNDSAWEIVFWTLGPPLWFFLEYFLIDREWIEAPPMVAKEALLEETKNYADYASKIWAAVLAVVTFLYGTAT